MELRIGGLVIRPEVSVAQIGPSSIDLHLSNKFTIFKKRENLGALSQSVDLANIDSNVEAIVAAVGNEIALEEGKTHEIAPGEFSPCFYAGTHRTSKLLGGTG